MMDKVSYGIVIEHDKTVNVDEIEVNLLWMLRK